jgi:hypothetical protein
MLEFVFVAVVAQISVCGLRYTQRMAEDEIRMDYEFNETGVEVTSLQSGRTHTSSLPAVRDSFLIVLGGVFGDRVASHTSTAPSFQ